MDPLSLFLLTFFIGMLFVIGTLSVGKSGSITRSYLRLGGKEQMELDLRLTYKRFKELYPYTEMSYQEYRQLQMQRSFRRAVSSEKNKRMVR
jgi:hypothetical protein